MATWLTSDHHFYHAKIIEYCSRPFKSVEDMNEAMVRNWNELVKPDDEVIVVGDFSMAFRSVELFTPRLLGRKTLVQGNHDHGHPSHKKSRTPEKQAEWIQKYLECGWEKVCLRMELDLPGVGLVNVCHLPYKGGGDSGNEERHEAHRPDDDGRWLLCGHVHEKWLFNKKQYNVGVDQHDMKPVSQEDVAKAILERAKEEVQ